MKNNKALILSYGLILYAIWSVTELIVVPYMELRSLSGQTIDITKEILLKSLIWFLPAMLILMRCDESMHIKKSELFSCKQGFIKAIPIFILFTAYHLINTYVLNGRISFDSSFHLSDILIALSVGLSEEIVFRGLFLNYTLKEDRKWIPILVNAGLFLMIHFPSWLRQGIFMPQLEGGAFVLIMILSFIFSWTFIKSKSIVIPIILHAYWDLLCFIL